jgi:hypothetical protein
MRRASSADFGYIEIESLRYGNRSADALRFLLSNHCELIPYKVNLLIAKNNNARLPANSKASSGVCLSEVLAKLVFNMMKPGRSLL